MDRENNTIQQKIHRIKRDLEEIKSIQLIGAKDIILYETIKTIHYPGAGRYTVSFIAEKQDNAFCEMGYETNIFIPDLTKKHDPSNPKASRFEFLFVVTTPRTVIWHALSTDRGEIIDG